MTADNFGIFQKPRHLGNSRNSPDSQVFGGIPKIPMYLRNSLDSQVFGYFPVSQAFG